jgi:poly [ADP-ribose] polymerase 2/3/4
MNEIRLIQVSPDGNHNKFYTMREEGGQFVAEYGRVGVTKQQKIYPLSRWDRIYSTKVRKGYEDVTDLFTEAATTSEFSPIADTDVRGVVSRLQSLARQSVEENYTVSSEAVTQAQIDRAQIIIDQLSGKMKSKQPTEPINRSLLQLFQIIPRKMRKVGENLIEGDVLKRKNLKQARQIISQEQDLLDQMAGQVRVGIQPALKNQTILEAFALEMDPVNRKEETLILKLLGDSKGRYRHAFRVVNLDTQRQFDQYLGSQKHSDTTNLWHGSRNENWWSIIDTGLLIRPSNAHHSGSMFGDGIYFAPRAKKSIGYTSVRNSYWAGGDSPFGFLAVYKVHTGNPLRTPRHEHWHYNLNRDALRDRGDYDSLFAAKGESLYNDEWIVYHPHQSTIQFLVEIHE